MFLQKEKLAELHAQFEGMTLEELRQHDDKLVDQLVGYKPTITSETASEFKKFIDTVPLNPGFGLASSVVKLYDKLVELANGSTEDVHQLNIADVRTFQKLLVDSKPVTIVQMRCVAETLRLASNINMTVGSLEDEQKFLSQYIVRKENEEATGMQYSAEDNQNFAQINTGQPAAEQPVPATAEEIAADVQKDEPAFEEKQN